ncbi:DUF2799 domain-containing protein [Hellea balneolensis]|uniref:DUF2799 domain-containing protein n=1 Tax=Hellea balneolensis TaxID=287478 RepID=UPI00042217F7|nr:DUF2799 domain-containing protein [Hellea balneolensis]
MRVSILNIAIISTAVIGLAGCASISESQCVSGSWSDIGYKDGVNGKPRDKLADYAKTCAKYGVQPDRKLYLTAFESGLTKYCTYEQGFELGENGSSYNQVCSGAETSGFSQGYDEGRAAYEIYKEHKRLVENYDDMLEALVNVRGRLAGDIIDKDDEGNVIPLSAKERKRLIKKQYRLEGELDDLRQDVREFEYENDISRHSF